ncbi:MAG TPA: hypothetical protein VNZ45_14560 [Bacteroidia bacterium]|nr:hypothetical protein [Bacteroidia bacterium]
MKKLSKHIIWAIITISLFSACSSGNKFASSFGKRKYIKGYYQDMPSNTPKVAGVSEEKKPISNSIITISSNLVEKKTSAPELAKLVKAFLEQASRKTIKSSYALLKHGTLIGYAPSILNSLLSVQTDGDKPTGDKEKKSNNKFSMAGFWCFLTAIGFILISIAAAVVFAADGGFALVIFAIAGIIAIILDVVAMILAFIGIAIGEDRIVFADFVLFINLIVLIIVIAAFAGSH